MDMVRKTALLSMIVLLAGCADRADTLDESPGIADSAGTAAADDAIPATPAPAGTAPAARDVPAASAQADSTVSPGTAPGNVLFIGTSLTAGYGVGEERAYPAVIQEKIDSAGLPFRVVNAGVSGETSAGGLARLDWALRTPIDVLVVELGANDGLRGLPVEQMRANLDSILVRTGRAYPDAALVIAGMEAPPNLGPDYTTAFRQTFGELAELRGATLIPFLLDGVAGLPELNQADGIHPTPQGHRLLGDNVWRVLAPLLEHLRETAAA
jgi:acyl-CoA thioesterase-1